MDTYLAIRKMKEKGWMAVMDECKIGLGAIYMHETRLLNPARPQLMGVGVVV